MNKKIIRLTESDLHRIIKESVKRVLNEVGDTSKGQHMLGRLHAKKVVNSEDDDVFDYARDNRRKVNGLNDCDEFGNTKNPLYNDYVKGFLDELPKQQRKKAIDRFNKYN